MFVFDLMQRTSTKVFEKLNSRVFKNVKEEGTGL